jgi:hypothetical protein
MRDEQRKRGRRIIPLRQRVVRFDAPAAAGADGLVRRGVGLVRSLVVARAGVCRVERRRDARYRPGVTRAWAGWWTGQAFRLGRAEIINLSKGGGLVLLTCRPPLSQPIWVCLSPPSPAEYVQARVLDAAVVSTGDYRARLEFHEPAPPSFFRDAGCGAGED